MRQVGLPGSCINATEGVPEETPIDPSGDTREDRSALLADRAPVRVIQSATYSRKGVSEKTFSGQLSGVLFGSDIWCNRLHLPQDPGSIHTIRWLCVFVSLLSIATPWTNLKQARMRRVDEGRVNLPDAVPATDGRVDEAWRWENGAEPSPRSVGNYRVSMRSLESVPRNSPECNILCHESYRALEASKLWILDRAEVQRGRMTGILTSQTEK
jgi:hypothetical protein